MRILDTDEYLNEVGQSGLYQARTQFIFALFMIPLSTQVFITYFVLHDPPWRCATNSTICLYNDTIVPQDHLRFEEKCKMARKEWEYTTAKEYSLVTEFDLVCAKETYALAPASMLFIGWAIGGIIVAYLSDRIGRKRTIYMCTIITLASAIMGAVIGDVLTYIICRFIIGLALGGGPVTIFVLAAEIVGSKHRALSCTAIWIYYSLALILLAIVAYLVANWRMLELINSVPFLLLVFSWRYFPESIRWMCIHGKQKEAEALLATMARTNGMQVPNAVLATLPTTTGNASVFRIFYPLKLFLETFIQMTIWFCSGLTYYAATLASQDLTGSFYSDFVFLSLVEIPANLALIFLCEKIGRKKVVILHLYLAVAACTAVAFVPLDISGNNGVAKYLRFSAGLIAKYAVTVYFNAIYIWSAELIPTVVRTQGVGLFVVVSRIAGIFSPIVITKLKNVMDGAPYLLLAIINIITGTMGFYLQETKNSVILETMDDKLNQLGITREKN